MRRIWGLFFVIFITSIVINRPIFAQVSLDRYKEVLTVTPGETVRGYLTLRNPSKSPIFLKTYFEDVELLPPYDGTKKQFLHLGSTPYSCGNWFIVSPETLVVPASGEQEVAYVIKVPVDAKGSYSSVLLFQEDSGKPQPMGVGVILRVGCTFFLNTKDLIKEGRIENVSVVGNGFRMEVLNTGDALLVLKPAFHVMDKNGSIFDRSKKADLILLPGKKAPLDIKLERKIPSGAYTLFVSMELEKGKSISSEVDFLKDESGNLVIGKAGE